MASARRSKVRRLGGHLNNGRWGSEYRSPLGKLTLNGNRRTPVPTGVGLGEQPCATTRGAPK